MWKFICLFLFALLALGQTSLAYDCSDIKAGGFKFNLSSLNKEVEKTQREETPPTITETKYLINPCAPLTYDDSSKDHCDGDTYICQIIVNYLKDTDNDPRTISIKSIATGDLNDTHLAPSSKDSDTHGDLSILLRGGHNNKIQQQANLTFICSDQGNDINIRSYKENTLFIEWKTKAACGVPISNDDEGMSLFTKFIIILILIGLCYFGIGAAYNYHVYKAHGLDLLPHLDFWRDFPYLISDFFKYVVHFIRTGRPGYARI